MIKKATNNDIDTIYDLICILENRILEKNIFKNFFCENIKNTNIQGFVFEHDGRIIGFINIYINCLLHHCEKIAEIQELVIVENHRNQKIGQKLIDFAIALSIENGCSQIEACSNIKRLKAHNFYIKNEFKRSHFKFVKNITASIF